VLGNAESAAPTVSDLDSITTGNTSDIKYGARSTVARARTTPARKNPPAPFAPTTPPLPPIVNTNSVIVIADPAVQQMYQDLIKKLRRAPPAGADRMHHRHARYHDGQTFGVTSPSLGDLRAVSC